MAPKTCAIHGCHPSDGWIIEKHNKTSISMEKRLLSLLFYNFVVTDISTFSLGVKFKSESGVVWHTKVPIPGAADCTNNLKKMGKNIKYVSNNALNTPEGIADTLKRLNHDVDTMDVINPIVSIISYFKSIQFKDEIFLIGSEALRDKLSQAGFNIVPESPAHTQKTIASILEHYEENTKIKAVVFELDVTLDYLKLQKCLWYLKQPDCKFVVGMDDKLVPTGPKGSFLGSYYFIESIKAATGKEPIRLAKPSQYFVDLIKSILKITEPNRVLMIGDTVEQDMVTAVQGGFQKLLVLSGNTTSEDINNWKYSEECKPEYYVENLNVFNKIIKSIFSEL